MQILSYFSIRSVRMAFRLVRGAFWLIISILFLFRKNIPLVISFDVFGTLLQRIADEHFAARASAEETFRLARMRGFDTQADPLAFRRQIETKLLKERLDINASLEIDNKTIIYTMLMMLGCSKEAEQDATMLARRELEYEISCTRPRTEIVEILKKFSATGRRIIAVSDTRYSEIELHQLLEKNGIIGIGKIYSSFDQGISKFRGGLFDIVVRHEGIKPNQILHIGDNICADILSASDRGWQVRWVRRPKSFPALPSAPDILPPVPAYSFGYEILGPILVGFTRLLIAESLKKGINSLAFIARDGFIMSEVIKILFDESQINLNIAFSYIKISRRLALSSTIDFLVLARSPALLERVISDVQRLRGADNLITRFAGLFNIPESLIEVHCVRLGLVLGDEAELRLLLSDLQAATEFSLVLSKNREIFLDHLKREGLFSSATALVDIGWRGTIHSIIGDLAKDNGEQVPHAFYFGFWEGVENNYIGNSSGLIADTRLGKNPYEMAAFQVLSLLEACFQADHGMVTSLSYNLDREISAIFMNTGAARDFEVAAAPVRNYVQQGVFDYAAWYGKNFPILAPIKKQIRLEVQKLLLKLAYFPEKRFRDVGYQLAHIEPTDDKIATPLILSRPTSFRGWVRGLRSPWKGGYFMENGGYLLAFIYFVFSAAFVYLSEERRMKIRRLLFGKRA